MLRGLRLVILLILVFPGRFRGVGRVIWHMRRRGWWWVLIVRGSLVVGKLNIRLADLDGLRSSGEGQDGDDSSLSETHDVGRYWRCKAIEVLYERWIKSDRYHSDRL
jgi:hypothetical protein